VKRKACECYGICGFVSDGRRLGSGVLQAPDPIRYILETPIFIHLHPHPQFHE